MLQGIIQIAVLLVVLGLLARPLGAHMAHVYRGERTFLHPVLRPVERLVYRVCAVDENSEMNVRGYVAALLVFNFVVLLFVYAVLRLQGHLPLNPAHVPGMDAWTAFNTAASFATNTNWQVYVPETAVSYLTQMLALTRENFVSAAVGMAVAVAFVRGLTRRSSRELGNFWVDLTRGLLYILLPLSVVGALFLVSQGVIQNLDGPAQVTTLEGAAQTIAQGPVASQEIIKELGTNGGGFFNANAAHPYENPTPLTGFVLMLAMLAIPVRVHVPLRAVRGQPAPGLGALRRRGGAAGAQRRRDVRERAGRQPEPDPRGSRPDRVGDAGRRQHGGQGGAQRHRRLRAVGDDHHRHLHGRRQRLTRQPHAARRRDGDAQHRPRRGGVRRRRRRPDGVAWCSPSWRCSSPASWSAARPSTWARRSRVAR